jgi:hypothetical protein
MLPAYVRSSISTTVPAILGHFGPRLLVFQSRILVSELVHVLGHDPRNLNRKKNSTPPSIKDMYTIIQRKADAKRKSPLERYVMNRSGMNPDAIGALPAISIVMTTRPEFELHPDGITVDLNYGSAEERLLLDGLCRGTVSLDLFEAGSITDRNYTLPVTFYAPSEGALTVKDFGQMFRDFDLATPIPELHSAALDTASLWNTLTRRIAESAPIRDHGGILDKKAQVPKGSNALVTFKILRRFIVGACEGTKYQERDNYYPDPDHANLTRETFEAVAVNIEAVLDGFAKRMGSVRFKNPDSFHLRASAWQALGLLIHDLFFVLHADQTVIHDVLDRLASLDWSNTSEVSALAKGGGRSNRAAVHTYLREKTGVAAMLAATVPACAAE